MIEECESTDDATLVGGCDSVSATALCMEADPSEVDSLA